MYPVRFFFNPSSHGSTIANKHICYCSQLVFSPFGKGGGAHSMGNFKSIVENICLFRITS